MTSKIFAWEIEKYAEVLYKKKTAVWTEKKLY